MAARAQEVVVQGMTAAGIRSDSIPHADADNKDALGSIGASGVTPAVRYARLERFADLVISLAVLVLSLPILAIAVVAVYLDSPGPIIFRQIRVGKNGRLFTCYKFRSMHHAQEDSDPVYEAIATHWMAGIPVEGEPDGDNTRHGARPVFKAKNDPRITRVGRILRKTSIDELPQFFNVVRGDMSVVGPRPPTPFEVERYSERAMWRLSVKPGITGVWQVKGRGRVTFDEMVEMDLDYVQNNSLVRDVVLIVLTVPMMLIGKGAG